MPIALLPPQIVEIAGADAIAFAQAQFSSDVHALANGQWQWSAWLSSQGRVRALFQLLRDDDERLRLILRGSMALRLRDALARYVFRAKVQLHAIDDQLGYVIEQADATAMNFPLPAGKSIAKVAQSDSCVALPGNPSRWLWLHQPDSVYIAADTSIEAHNRNALADINAGIITLDEALEEQLLPDWIGLGELGATSVGKGCYPGQEVVARLHFKGGNKRWLHRLEFAADALPVPGTKLTSSSADDAEPSGSIVCSAWLSQGRGAALAVLRESAESNATIPEADGLKVLSSARVSPA